MAEIIMPKMGDAMSEGKVVRWYKKAGDAVKFVMAATTPDHAINNPRATHRRRPASARPPYDFPDDVATHSHTTSAKSTRTDISPVAPRQHFSPAHQLAVASRQLARF